jgi:hypothetical protein
VTTTNKHKYYNDLYLVSTVESFIELALDYIFDIYVFVSGLLGKYKRMFKLLKIVISNLLFSKILVVPKESKIVWPSIA